MRAYRLGLLAAPLVLVACKVEPTSSGPVDAAGDGVTLDVTLPNDDVGPLPDSSVRHCTLNNGTDPVALCRQKEALGSLHIAAFDAKKGVAAGWGSSTGVPDRDDAGARIHGWRDDVGYAAATALYHVSADKYGDTELTPTLDADLLALAPLLEAELSPLPDAYEGEAYLRLRVAAGGLNILNDTMDGMALNGVADAYGKAIYTRFFFGLSAPPFDGGAAEGGSDASPADAGADDGGSVDASPPEAGPEDAGPLVADGIIGRPLGGDYAYVTADVATAALALLDLAVRYPTDASHTLWQLGAEAAFDHLYNRARDPATGLYYTALVTSRDPGHDAFDPSNPAAGEWLTDTTATVALALSRAADLVSMNASALPVVANYPFTQHVDDALASLNGTPSLYDGPSRDAGAVSTGFMEGYVPSSHALLSSKTTRGNAYLLAVLHRQVVMVGTTYGTEILPLVQTITSQGPPWNKSLYSVIHGQNAYLRACSRDFNLTGADGGAADPYAGSYRSAAIVTFVEGMSEMLYGVP